MKMCLKTIVGAGCILVGIVLSVSVLCIVYAMPISIVGSSYSLHDCTVSTVLGITCRAVSCFIAMGCVDAICARAIERWGKEMLFHTVRVALDFICAWASYSLVMRGNVALMAALCLVVLMMAPAAASFGWRWVSRAGLAFTGIFHQR